MIGMNDIWTEKWTHGGMNGHMDGPRTDMEGPMGDRTVQVAGSASPTNDYHGANRRKDRRTDELTSANTVMWKKPTTMATITCGTRTYLHKCMFGKWQQCVRRASQGDERLVSRACEASAASACEECERCICAACACEAERMRPMCVAQVCHTRHVMFVVCECT